MNQEEEVNDIQKSTRNYLFKEGSGHLLVSTIIGVGLTSFFLYSSISDSEGIVAIICSLLFLLLPGLSYARTYMTIEQRFYEQMAKELGGDFSVISEASPTAHQGVLFSTGSAKIIPYELVGKWGEYILCFFSYKYQSMGRLQTYSVFELRLGKDYPHVLCIPTGLHVVSPDLESVTLEGDFNKSFSLYVEKNKQLEARVLFTPELMVSIIDNDQKVAFELFKDKLHLLYPGKIQTRKEFTASITKLKKLADNLLPKLHEIL